MDAAFWHRRWETNETGWHERAVNPVLVTHFPALGLAAGSRLFVPLCGKSLDVGWLLSHGYRVAGAELSERAVGQLFADLDLTPAIADWEQGRHYRGPGLDVFVGDIFQLSRERLGPVDAVYDRAALVALPLPIRQRYAAHLTALTGTAPQLVICYDYDQSVIPGPPFSVTGNELRQHYADRYRLTLLASAELAGGLKGKCPALEQTWLLR